MRIDRSHLVQLLVTGAVFVTLTLPTTIVLAHGGGDSAHDAAGGGHGDVAAGGHQEVSSNGTDTNGDITGDIRSNMHTGAKGRGAGGDDKTEIAGSNAGAPLEVARPSAAVSVARAVETRVAVGAVTHPAVEHFGAPGAAGLEVAPAESAAGAPGASLGPGAAAAASSIPVLGAAQQRFVLGAQQVRPRTLPFTGLSAAWAMLISNGQWAGVLLGALGLMFLVCGLRRA